MRFRHEVACGQPRVLREFLAVTCGGMTSMAFYASDSDEPIVHDANRMFARRFSAYGQHRQLPVMWLKEALSLL
jgi:hypothetical protein